jgi:hypothetical protein
MGRDREMGRRLAQKARLLGKVSARKEEARRGRI